MPKEKIIVERDTCIDVLKEGNVLAWMYFFAGDEFINYGGVGQVVNSLPLDVEEQKKRIRNLHNHPIDFIKSNFKPSATSKSEKFTLCEDSCLQIRDENGVRGEIISFSGSEITLYEDGTALVEHPPCMSEQEKRERFKALRPDLDFEDVRIFPPFKTEEKS